MILTIKYPSNEKKKRRLRKQLDAAGLTSDEAESRIEAVWDVGKSMLDAGFKAIDSVMDLPRDERVTAFNSDKYLKRWFGRIERPKQTKTVHNRLAGIRR